MVHENNTPIARQWQHQRNYHYLRYAILGFFLVWMASVPNMLQSEFISLATVGYWGMAFSALCVIMDLRNYWLFVDEERDLRKALGKAKFSGPKVTSAIILFYLLVLVWFSQFVFQAHAKQLTLTADGLRRLSLGGAMSSRSQQTFSIVTKEKLVHLPGGWTRVTSTDGSEFLLRNEEIRSIKILSR